MIKVQGLVKSFGKLEVLKGIDYEVKEKEIICVIGPSGSGKSTFYDALICWKILRPGKFLLMV